MQEYMIVLKGGFENWATKSEADRQEVMMQFSGWAKSLKEKGHYQNCVRPVGENRKISKAGAQVVVDGPFPETKELISGAFFIQAKDIEQATELAQQSPVLNFGGSVEVFSLTDNRKE